MNDITIIVAFGAGIVSFLAPCVLPLVPGFIAYLGGGAIEKKAPNMLTSRFAMLYASTFFVLGFTAVFAVLGTVLHGALVQAGLELQVLLARIGGGIVIFFGLYLMGLVKLSFLERSHKFICIRCGVCHRVDALRRSGAWRNTWACGTCTSKNFFPAYCLCAWARCSFFDYRCVCGGD